MMQVAAAMAHLIKVILGKVVSNSPLVLPRAAVVAAAAVVALCALGHCSGRSWWLVLPRAAAVAAAAMVALWRDP